MQTILPAADLEALVLRLADEFGGAPGAIDDELQAGAHARA